MAHSSMGLCTAVTGAGPFCLVPRDTEIARDYTTDAYGVRLFLLYKGQRIKFEIVKEGNLILGGRDDPDLLVPILTPESMYATKLLANADCWRDRAVAYRDAIDLGMLIKALGAIPRDSFEKSLAAYGDLTIRRGMVGVVNLFGWQEQHPSAARLDLHLWALVRSKVIQGFLDRGTRFRIRNLQFKGQSLIHRARVKVIRTTSDTVSPISANTAAASSFRRSSMRARTNALEAMIGPPFKKAQSLKQAATHIFT